VSGLLIAAIGIGYAVIAAIQFFKDNPAMGIVFAGYAFSNVGLYFASK